jgi:hypothetical protein
LQDYILFFIVRAVGSDVLVTRLVKRR